MSRLEEEPGPPIRTLLIDNYDSFTYNLYQLLAVVNGTPPFVVFNDAFGGDWEKVCEAYPEVDNIVISPGPGTPENPTDFGLSTCAFASDTTPVLGICLGHQGLGYFCGGKITPAPEIVHGRCSLVEFSSTCILFRGLGASASVARYHSLCIDPQSLPECLSVTAWTRAPSFTIMGVEHRHQPFFGIQFHPESVGTPSGARILANFNAFTREWRKARRSNLPQQVNYKAPRMCGLLESRKEATRIAKREGVTQERLWQVNVAEVLVHPNKEAHSGKTAGTLPVLNSCRLFERLFADSPACFWLDSSSADPSLACVGHVEKEQVSRFSFMGDALGPCAFALESWTDASTRQLFRCPQGCSCSADTPSKSWHSRELSVDPFDALRVDGLVTTGQEALRLRRWRAAVTTGEARDEVGELQQLLEEVSQPAPPPFDFWGGFVGYFAYELRHRACTRLREAQGDSIASPATPGGKGLPQRAPSREQSPPQAATSSKEGPPGASPPRHPLSLWLFADRFVALDNHEGRCYIVWLNPLSQAESNELTEAKGLPHQGPEQRLPHQGPSQQGRPQQGPPGITCEPLASALVGGRVTQEACRLIARAQESWAVSILSEIAGCFEFTACHETQEKEEALEEEMKKEAALRFEWALTEAKYKSAIRVALGEIEKGNAYEVCLTDQTTAVYDPQEGRPTPFKLYTRLRANNRAKLGAFLKCDWSARLRGSKQRLMEGEKTALAVCCSSPELFLHVDSKNCVESRPIKGTRRRGHSPQEDEKLKKELEESEKDKAENMMIVDLVRNDLGRVCVEGSVSVPRFLSVETHPAVHHMVSVVRGQLREEEYDAIDAVVAAFPGGSMTGAPKISAMQIIDRCEAGPRGIYSGSLGFFSITRAACLNIVIRTAVCDPYQIAVGSGGAIINLSNVDEEYQEKQLKAESVIRHLK
ncbi:hypothetical protein ACSSS7_002236 [Eimeria intestinalis]